MERPTSKVLARRAARVRAGVIVSTVTEEAYAQTVTFISDPSERLGFRMVVTYAAPGRDREAHARAVSVARHPASRGRVTGVHMHYRPDGWAVATRRELARHSIDPDVALARLAGRGRRTVNP